MDDVNHPAVARIYLPPDANALLSVADHCLGSHNYTNLIVIDKQPQLQRLSMDDASRALSRTWLQLARHDDDAIRPGRPESYEPLSPRHARDPAWVPAGDRATALVADLHRHIDRAIRYSREHVEDPAE